jgi:hypothetical protein
MACASAASSEASVAECVSGDDAEGEVVVGASAREVSIACARAASSVAAVAECV